MTPADRRITELIDKWLASIDLHLQYVELSDASYARAHPWPRHDRPTRWVLEVARQKVLELKQHCETRQAMGDAKFSESLELMAFLANLVGIQHIQRFIPLADPAKAEATSGNSQTVEAPTVIRTGPQRTGALAEEPTREMPRIKVEANPAPVEAKPAPAQPKPAQPKPVEFDAPILTPPQGPRGPVKASRQAQRPAAAAATATQAQRPAATAATTAQAQRPTAAAATTAQPAPSPKAVALDMKGKIIADAVRLLKWGKQWHELPDLIERIGERPPAAEIRKVLRANKGEIEERAQA